RLEAGAIGRPALLRDVDDTRIIELRRAKLRVVDSALLDSVLLHPACCTPALVDMPCCTAAYLH
ncbi:MAG TPA: hypothetical protein VF885_04305, partial [Arthrobacter sp.]